MKTTGRSSDLLRRIADVGPGRQQVPDHHGSGADGHAVAELDLVDDHRPRADKTTAAQIYAGELSPTVDSMAILDQLANGELSVEGAINALQE